jgi:hypothetical protein
MRDSLLCYKLDGELAVRTILGGWISILLGLSGLWFTVNPDVTQFSIFQVVLLTISVLGILFMIYWDIHSYLKRRPKLYRTTEQIDRYMYAWISQRGRVLIFTRDMSWATSNEINKLLMNKADRRELEICLPEPTLLTKELAAAGAEVHTYTSFNDSPYSRFTIIRYGKDDARIAIGRNVDGLHRIDEYSYGSDPVFSIAYDLVRLVKHYSS